MRLPAAVGKLENASLADQIPLQSRYFVRMGGKGWVVYDRERKGPALATSYSKRPYTFGLARLYGRSAYGQSQRWLRSRLGL